MTATLAATMKIYRVFPPHIATPVDPADAEEMRRAREYFHQCGLAV